MEKNNVVQAFKTIYDMRLHETLSLSRYLEVTRVPGGWVYELYDPCSEATTAVFVPFDNEFQEVKNETTT